MGFLNFYFPGGPGARRGLASSPARARL